MTGDPRHDRTAIAGPDSYADLIARLSRLSAERLAEEKEVDRWYAEQGRAAEEAVVRSARQVRAAQEALAKAQSLTLHTEKETVRLWAVLQSRLAYRRRRDPLLHAPPPRPEESMDSSGETDITRPGQLLDEARELLDKITEGRVRRRPRGRVAIVLVVLLVAAAAGLAAAALLHR